LIALLGWCGGRRYGGITVTTIVLGHDAKKPSTPIELDIDRLIAGKLLVQASSGGGKSYLIRRLAEQLFGKVPVAIIDPEGEFASLRERFGYALIGPEGDAPADTGTAGQHARQLLEVGLSAVCDLSSLPRRPRSEWVAAFIRALIHAPRHLWRPMILFIDESHTFAPQRASSAASEAMMELASLGRKRSLGSVFSTQRLAKLDKDVAAEALSVLIGRTKLPPDVARARGQLDIEGRAAAQEFSRTVTSLMPGEFYASGEAFPEPTIIKIGKVTTTHPQPGSSATAPVPPAPAEIRHLLRKLAVPVPPPTGDSATVETQAEVLRLRAEIAALRARPPEVRVQQVPVIPPALQKHIATLSSAIAALEAAVSDAGRTSHPPPSSAAQALPPAVAQPASRKQTDPTPASTSDMLGSGPLRMLRVLARAEGRGVTRTALAVLSGLSHKGGTFANYLSLLNTRHLAARHENSWSITPEGLREAGQFDRSLSAETILELWRRELPGKAVLMLQHLLQTRHVLSRSELATLAGIESSGGTFANYLSALRSNGLIEGAPGGYKASDAFFIFS